MAWVSGAWASGAWYGTAWYVPAAAPAATTPAVGGGRRRRRHIIDGVIYEGTEEQLEALLWELLDQQREPEKPAKVARKKLRAKKKPVELKADYTPQPVVFDLPKFQQLVADTFRHEDAFLRAMLERMRRQWEEDEDVVILLLS